MNTSSKNWIVAFVITKTTHGIIGKHFQPDQFIRMVSNISNGILNQSSRATISTSQANDLDSFSPVLTGLEDFYSYGQTPWKRNSCFPILNYHLLSYVIIDICSVDIVNI